MISAADNSQAKIKAQAAAGYFRAIALWLNQPVVDQGIYVQVQGGQAGCLQLTVEFHRPPQPERLIRFLCHRIWQLNSPFIEGIHIIGRPTGRRSPLWQRKIRIMTPAIKQRGHSRLDRSQALPPNLQRRSAARKTAKRVSKPGLNSHLKTLRACVLSGSAVAAFVLGCLMEVVISGSGPVLPSFSADGRTPASQPQPTGSVAVNDFWGTTQVSYTPRATAQQEPRPAVVDAAVEPVGVIPFKDIQNPATPDVTLLFGGDFPLEGMPEEVLTAEALPLEGIDAYQDVDVAMMNLGTSLTEAATTLEESYYQRARSEAAELLKQGGVDIVTLSDTNIMEYGEQGLTDTINTLDQAGVYRVGAGRNEDEARRPEILDVKGERIAYLSYSQGGDYAAHQERSGVNAQDLQEIADDIRSLRDEVDWIVVNYRWQTDLTEQPSSWQTNLARLAIDQGADLVVGYHPQQLQGAEIYKGRPIAYALSDFIFRMEPDKSDPYAEEVLKTDQDTAVLKVSLRQEQMKVEFLPVQVRDAHPTLAQGSAEKAIRNKIARASQGFEQPMQSPLVLDRKAPLPQPQPSLSPNSPFVQPSESSEDMIPTEPVSAPTNTEGEWMLELEMPAEEELKDWGPKGGSEEKFQPIPEVMPEEPQPPVTPAQQVQYESRLPETSSDATSTGDRNGQSETSWINEASAAPQSEEADETAGEKAAPSPELPALDGPALAPETVPKPAGIKPYSEPLIGPLSAVDGETADADAPQMEATSRQAGLSFDLSPQRQKAEKDGDFMAQSLPLPMAESPDAGQAGE